MSRYSTSIFKVIKLYYITESIKMRVIRTPIEMMRTQFKQRGKMISKTRTRFFLKLSKYLFNFMFLNEKKAPQSLLCRIEHKRCSLNPEKNHRVRFISDCCLRVKHIYTFTLKINARVNELNKFLLIREMSMCILHLMCKIIVTRSKIANTRGEPCE